MIVSFSFLTFLDLLTSGKCNDMRGVGKKGIYCYIYIILLKGCNGIIMISI